MASRKPTKSQNKTWETKFVSCELDKETKEVVKKWDVKFETTMDCVDKLIQDGYKISISQDKFHDCTGVFMTIADSENPNHGWCLSARGPNYLQALKVLVYKHFTILQENWDTDVNQTYERDTWG